VNSFNLALENYHTTSSSSATPEARYKRPAFGLAAKKAIATFLAIGTGGAGGITAPMVTISEALGAGVARIAGARSVSELQTCQLAAIAAAIATLFRTPFAGALFALEIVYGDRIAYQKLVFCLLAASVAYSLTEYVFPLDPIYLPPPHARAYGFTDYAITTLVAVFVSGPVALGFAWVTTRAQLIVRRYNPALMALTGTFFTGMTAVILWEAFGMDPEHVLGVGSSTIEELLAGNNPDLGIWWFLAIMVAGRIITVAFTVGSGGSVGLFLPAAFFGGVSGAAIAELLNSWGELGQFDPSLFIVVGIASALVALIRIPLTAIALTIEVFGPTYAPAAAMACALTYVISLRVQIYRNLPQVAKASSVKGTGR
jgi:CIC family chloride channel protein